MTDTKISPADIRQARADNPKLRERDLADQLKISEAEFVAAWCGETATRLKIDMDAIFGELQAVGEVLALTRNESAVHEKIGVYDNYHSGNHASMMLGADIDTRMFPKHFVHAFEVTKATENGPKRSLQIFDAHGDAVHKIHLREKSNLHAWSKLIASLHHEDQSQTVSVTAAEKPAIHPNPQEVAQELRERWEKMTDIHQFAMILRKLKLSRHQAVTGIGEDLAWPIDPDGINAMMMHAANDQLPIMCFVGSRGCIQIHSGPIETVKPMGPWLNIMDPTFHLHLRTDHIAQAWAVRKPTDKGHVTSVEAYNAEGELIIQFFGQRAEGKHEREDWRFIVENLPRVNRDRAA